mmetsp:Transcript_93935/g.166226  ORF Transcript_93935/g.166226 Transcript_93935/m.166226 type:complete len:193 (-) Transcript_93935:154-732(-)
MTGANTSKNLHMRPLAQSVTKVNNDLRNLRAAPFTFKEGDYCVWRELRTSNRHFKLLVVTGKNVDGSYDVVLHDDPEKKYPFISAHELLRLSALDAEERAYLNAQIQKAQLPPPAPAPAPEPEPAPAPAPAPAPEVIEEAPAPPPPPAEAKPSPYVMKMLQAGRELDKIYKPMEEEIEYELPNRNGGPCKCQ